MADREGLTHAHESAHDAGQFIYVRVLVITSHGVLQLLPQPLTVVNPRMKNAWKQSQALG